MATMTGGLFYISEKIFCQFNSYYSRFNPNSSFFFGT